MRLLALSLLLFSACTPDPEPPPDPAPEPTPVTTDDSIVGIVGTSSELSTLAGALDASGLAETLRDPEGAYTLFAPSDAAFASLPDGERTALFNDPDRLSSLLRSHALPTRMLSVDIIDGLSIETLGGTELALQSDGSTVRITGPSGTPVTVTTPDLDTSNGVVHIIDAVLLP